jgi:filamentous hemagglutinin family protein
MLKIFNVFLAISVLPVTSILYALPEATTPVSGGGSFSVNGNEMMINAPNNSIFEHQNFNVSSSEVVRFVQPDANARVLNRILSNTPSLVNGSIIANGKVYFSSPGGLVFGEGSAVDVGLLHAIGGDFSDENFLNSHYSYEQLTGTIENHGLINAREVILAGNKVINTGKIIVSSGDVVLAVGEGAIIESIDGTLGIEVSQGSQVEDIVASDFAGQAVLQSGIIESARTRIHGDAIEQTGTIKSNEVMFSDFSHLESQGEIQSSAVTKLSPRNISSGSNAKLTNGTNRMNQISIEGRFNELSIYALGKTTVLTPQNSPTSSNLLTAQSGEFKITDGSLLINASFAPIYTATESNMLIAAEGQIEFENKESLSGYDRVVLFGTNINDMFLSSIEGEFENMNSLKTSELRINDLEVGLNPASILLLAEENPGFTGFSNGLTGGVSLGGLPSSTNLDFPEVPQDPELATPTAPVGSDNGGTTPTGPSSTELSQFQSVTEAGLSYEQVKVAMDYGLFSGYSYLIEYIDPDSSKDFANQLADLGGASSMFGGSYDVVESDESTVATSGDDDEGESEEEDDSESSVTVMSDSADTKTIGSALSTAVVGVAPFSPISRPVYSPEAAGVLDAALGPQIFENLQQYTNR